MTQLTYTSFEKEEKDTTRIKSSHSRNERAGGMLQAKPYNGDDTQNTGRDTLASDPIYEEIPDADLAMGAAQARNAHNAWSQCIRNKEMSAALVKMCNEDDFNFNTKILVDEQRYITAFARTIHFLVSIYPKKQNVRVIWENHLVKPYLKPFRAHPEFLEIATGMKTPLKMDTGDWKQLMVLLNIVRERFPRLSMATLYPDSMLPPSLAHKFKLDSGGKAIKHKYGVTSQTLRAAPNDGKLTRNILYEGAATKPAQRNIYNKLTRAQTSSTL
jgi:hypothetical protein